MKRKTNITIFNKLIKKGIIRQSQSKPSLFSSPPHTSQTPASAVPPPPNPPHPLPSHDIAARHNQRMLSHKLGRVAGTPFCAPLQQTRVPKIENHTSQSTPISFRDPVYGHANPYKIRQMKLVQNTVAPHFIFPAIPRT